MRIFGTLPILTMIATVVLNTTDGQASNLGAATEQVGPNVIVIFADDLGYGDVGCFGATDIATPNIDRLAREGRRFTDFYVAQAVCTASRAALMTGCYPNRVSLSGALNHTSTNGIHPAELLLPEILQQRGYATAIFGKWHLGTAPEFHPLNHGFDRFFGIPYSNDNSKYHPVLHASMPPLPLYKDKDVIETDPDQSQFTRRFTEQAIEFLRDNKERPFFLYVPHVMPHVPIFRSEAFAGKSKRGLYGDVVTELDWSVGEILHSLKDLDLEQNTLVIFMSDNGPFLSYGDHAGSAGALREGKLTSFEGGVRTPCLMRWPEKITAGTECHEPACTIDLPPTIAKLTEAKGPNLKIDGLDISPLILGNSSEGSPHEAIFIYAGEELQAVRSGEWKLHFAHDYLTVAGEPGRSGKPANFNNLKPASITQSGIQGIATRHGYQVAHIDLALFNMKTDPGEKANVASKHPEVVERLSQLAATIRRELGDELTATKGSEIRAAGQAVTE
jgi:arylsulfatase A-like enzyme